MSTTLNPYLNFNGNAREAMEFYKSVLGGELSIQTFAESGMPVEENEKNLVVHAVLKNGDIHIMASDAAHGQKVTFGDNVHMSLVGSDEVGLTKIFNSLAEGGNAHMPLAKQFWGDTFGMLTDKFGVHWMVNITGTPTKVE